MQFRWSHAKSILGIPPLLGLFVAGMMWLTILLMVSDSESWHTSDSVRRRSPRQVAPSKYTLSVPHGAVYVPTGLDSEEETYEAELAVPCVFAQRLLGEDYGYLSSMEDKYGVSAGPGSVGGRYSAGDGMFVTLRVRGAYLPVEYFRASMRSSVHAAEMERIAPRVYGEYWEYKALSVPYDILAVFGDDREKRIEELGRRTDIEVQISEEPDPDDPTARLVTISGGAFDVAEDRGLYLLMKELARAFDSFTPGVWETVSARIDPEKAILVTGENDSIINDLVDRTGCRVQFGPVLEGSYSRQKVRITGPGDAPKELRRDIRTLIKDGESRTTPQQEYGDVAAQNYADFKAWQQRYEDRKMKLRAESLSELDASVGTLNFFW